MELNEFKINATDNREYKRALAVDMKEKEYHTSVVSDLLGVSESFVKKWWGVFKNSNNDASALCLAHKGSQGYLIDEQRLELILYIKTLNYWTLKEMKHHIKEKYGVEYKSDKSYHELMKLGELSWKKTEKENPAHSPEKAATRIAEIKKKLESSRKEIESGKKIVLLQDETHMRWGDLLGYTWSKRGVKISAPISNEKKRQTFYGAVDIVTGEFVNMPASAGNGLNTVVFLSLLISYFDGQIIIIWDGASYHTGKDVANFLKEVNGDLPESERRIHLELLPPASPQFNPVENIWGIAKNHIRKKFFELDTFHKVKNEFNDYLNSSLFSFTKLFNFGDFLT